MQILYTQSNFRQKRPINGQNSAQQAYKIWCKSFQTLPINHILGAGSFLAAPCMSAHL